MKISLPLLSRIGVDLCLKKGVGLTTLQLTRKLLSRSSKKLSKGSFGEWSYKYLYNGKDWCNRQSAL